MLHIGQPIQPGNLHHNAYSQKNQHLRVFFKLNKLNVDTTSCELMQLVMLAIRVETKGIPTLSWKDLMSFAVILNEMAFSKLFSMSHNANTHLAAGFSASSLVCNVTSTREDMIMSSFQFEEFY